MKRQTAEKNLKTVIHRLHEIICEVGAKRTRTN